jgi:hypothetical protein
MLHDLYLLSCYFEPTEAILYEDDIKRRYGSNAVLLAVKEGLLEFYRAPCLRGEGRCFYRLSRKGFEQASALAL